MTNPAQPAAHPDGRHAGTGGFAPPAPARPGPAPLAATSAALLVVSAGVALGGSFATIMTETQRIADGRSTTLTYTSWTLHEAGTLRVPIHFHAPHFGYPLVGSAVVLLLGAALLLFGTGRGARIAGATAAAGAGLLAGTVWAVGMATATDLDDVEHGDGFRLDWTSGLGFWLLVGAGAVAVVGGALAILAPPRPAPIEPVTPRYGFPVIGQQYQQPRSPGQGTPAQATPPNGTPAAGPAQPGPAQAGQAQPGAAQPGAAQP